MKYLLKDMIKIFAKALITVCREHVRQVIAVVFCLILATVDVMWTSYSEYSDVDMPK